ncbi:MAG: DUF1772 domain-containing protein, partial [Longimicrobiales bacterium]
QEAAMLIPIWRFTTLLLVALSMGLSFCHLMEMPIRLRWEPVLWITVTNVQGLYWLFGRVGAVIDVAAWVTAVALAFLVRQRLPAFWWTVLGAALMVVAHAAWWALVAPANAIMAGWSPEGIPLDFIEVRNQWEYTHATIALLKILGLCALLLSVLLETPRRWPREDLP